jgi:CBS domain-containing protein
VGGAEIRRFLAAHPPFAALSKATLDALLPHIETMQVDPDTVVLRARQHVRGLYIIRAGRIAIRGTNGDIWAQRSEGETFGVRALLGGGRSEFDAIALEPTTIYLLADGEFARLQSEYREFERFFAPLGGVGASPGHADIRLSGDIQNNLIALRVRDVMIRDPATLAADHSVREAALLMRSRQLSCLAVTRGDELLGLITNTDLRDRVVAEGVAPETPLTAVSPPPPIELDADGLAFDASLAMRQQGATHAPVMRAGRLVGILAMEDLQRRQSADFGYFGAAIERRQTPASLAQVVARVPQLLVTLVETGVCAHKVGLILSSIADMTTHRLLQLAEARLGPPPVPYIWLSSGSQARQEQTATTDQDNCLILDDRYEEAAHGAYFDDLARFVCSGLNACGYRYCPGEMMATTPQWRQPLATWITYFTSWIEEPAPMAQMLSSVMFDLRPVRGDVRLFDRLQEFTAARARKNTLFIAHMVSNALSHIPALGLFRNFVLVHGGEHDHELDLKLHGTVPIIDLARVYALLAGVKTANTHDRLVEAYRAGVLSETGMHHLIDALEFLSIARLRHQSRHILSGRAPDTFISPDELSRIERQRLRQAFLAVRAMQSSLASAYPVRP